MKISKITRVSGISREDFIEGHLTGSGKPVIVSGFSRSWPAGSKWTFEFFSDRYGKDMGLIPLVFGQEDSGKMTYLAEYIRNMDNPLEAIPGFWVDKNHKPVANGISENPSSSWYIKWKCFDAHPELLDDVLPYPDFVPDFLKEMDDSVKLIFEKTAGKDFRAIFLGRKGTKTTLHQDYSCTHGYLVQLAGTKKVILFSPEDTDFLYGGRIDPENPDFAENPLLKSVNAFEGIIEPGDFLFIPAEWWHCTEVLEKSITYSYSFFNQFNVRNYLDSNFRNMSKLADYFINSSHSPD